MIPTKGRIIPTYVGSTRTRTQRSVWFTNHSHVCGINFKEFQRTQQNAFNQWFAEVKGQLDSDAAGHLQNQADEHESRLAALEKMIIKNQISAPIATDDGPLVLLADDDGNVITADWKYAYM